jgi:hypothetical protein
MCTPCPYNNSPCTTHMRTTPKKLTSLYVHYIYTWFPTSHQPICTTTKGFGSGDITILSPLFMHCPQCIIYTCTYKISKIFKHMRILYSHSILTLLSCILETVPGSLDLYHLHGSIPELLNFVIQYANRSHLKSSFCLHLNHIPIKDIIHVHTS